MKKIVLILFCFPLLLLSQTIDYLKYDYSNIDSKVRLVKYEGDVQNLIVKLTYGLDDDHLKARAFYTWISDNIAYDCKGLKGKKKIDSNKIINLEILKKSKIIKKNSSKLKILGSGEILDKITLEANSFSKSAKIKLEKIGCTTQISKK